MFFFKYFKFPKKETVYNNTYKSNYRFYWIDELKNYKP